jgi:hypothetical protein
MQVYEGGREETTLKEEAPVVSILFLNCRRIGRVYNYVLFCFLFLLSRFLCL